MNLVKGVLGAIVGAGLGGALWTGVAIATGHEFSLIAIAIGAAAGFGMSLRINRHGGAVAGAVAAVIAIASVFGTKLAVASIMTQRWMESDARHVSESDARLALVDTVYWSFEEKGVAMTSPVNEDDYPPEAWAEADRRWYAMSPDERTAYRSSIEEEILAHVESAAGVASIPDFFASFGLFDVICVCVATGAAFKTASRRNPALDIVDVDEEDTTQAPALFRAAAVAATDPSPQAPSVATQPTATVPPRQSVAPRTASGPDAAPATASPPAPTGLGIFSIIGAPPTRPTPVPRSILGDEAAPSSPPTPGPRETVGLINLDINDAEAA